MLLGVDAYLAFSQSKVLTILTWKIYIISLVNLKDNKYGLNFDQK